MTAPLHRLFASFLLLIAAGVIGRAAISDEAMRSTVLVVVGAPGEDVYRIEFARQAGRWAEAAARAGAKHLAIGLEEAADGNSDLEKTIAALAAEPKEGPGELWLILIGHGTFDGREAKFNLRGTDLTATALAIELQAFKRPLAVINAASSSAPFMARLAAPGRVIVTSTRSGFEQNYARFGSHLADAIADPAADLDKDGQTSLLEGFLSASHRVNEFYKAEGRLATEHALIDDNGDGLGTPPEWFRGVRAVRKARDNATPDGTRAHQFHLVRSEAELALTPDARARRDAVEQRIARLREMKDKLFIEEYYRELEALLLELAVIYERSEEQ